jgi:lipooligosaccharide transport system permease protein
VATLTPPRKRGALSALRQAGGVWQRPGVAWRMAGRLWLRNWRLYARTWRRNILPNFFEPLLYLFAIGLGIGSYIRPEVFGTDYVVWIAPGLAAAAAMNGAVFETTYNVFIKYRYHKVYDAVITTPVEPQDVAGGEIVWAVTRSAIYGGAFVAVIGVLGFVRSPWILLAPVGIVLTGLAFALVGLVFTGLVPTIDLYSYFFTLFITPLFLFSGVFFPIENLPAVAQPIAWATPLHHAVELMRGLLLTGEVAEAGRHALWLVGFSAVLYPPAVNLLRRRLVV